MIYTKPFNIAVKIRKYDMKRDICFVECIETKQKYRKTTNELTVDGGWKEIDKAIERINNNG